MADPVYKVVEIVGTSEQSISKQSNNGITKASGNLARPWLVRGRTNAR